MTVLDPNNSIHTFTIVPRKALPENVNIVLFNKDSANGSPEAPVLAVVTPVDSRYNVRISLSVSEGQSYSFKLVDDSDCVYYRGRFFVTAQDPQNYKTDSGQYTYSTI